MRISQAIIFLTLNLNLVSYGQNKNDAFSLPGSFYKTKPWLAANMLREKKKIFYSDDSIVVSVPNGSVSRQLTIIDYMGIISRQSDYLSFLEATHFSIENYQKMIPFLISIIIDTTSVGLTGYSSSSSYRGNLNSTIIPGNLKKISGRASFILNEITGENFAQVFPNSSPNQLKKIQQLWIVWLKKLPQKPDE